tara:strand:+ start:168 stop:566 length:399 start_codon:yes stop_codon:yes gene_type:complete
MRKKTHTYTFFKKNIIQQNKLPCLGQFSIRASEPGFLTKNQIEASRKILARTLKKVNGRSWVKIQNFIPLTKKSKGARMGKGKGNFFCFVSPIKRGTILFEFQGLTEKEHLTLLVANISSKLPIKIRLASIK